MWRSVGTLKANLDGERVIDGWIGIGRNNGLTGDKSNQSQNRPHQAVHEADDTKMREQAATAVTAVS